MVEKFSDKDAKKGKFYKQMELCKMSNEKKDFYKKYIINQLTFPKKLKKLMKNLPLIIFMKKC